MAIEELNYLNLLFSHLMIFNLSFWLVATNYIYQMYYLLNCMLMQVMVLLYLYLIRQVMLSILPLS